MQLLLDECVDHRLRHFFTGHDCQSAQYAKLAGLKNGHLLEAAEAAGFRVLITADQEILHQQIFVIAAYRSSFFVAAPTVWWT